MRPKILSLTYISLCGVVNSQLSKRHYGHGHGLVHRAPAETDEAALTVVDKSVLAPTKVPKVIVYVDEGGQPIKTVTEMVLLVPQSIASQATPAAEATTAQPVNPPPPAQSQQPAQQPAQSQSPNPAPSNIPSPSPDVPISNAGSSALHGITYSPYNADGTCKTTTQVLADFRGLATTYGLVRLYGVDCNQVANGLAAAKAISTKLFLGIFNLDNLASQADAIIAAAKDSWAVIDTVSVGNELVNSGRASAAQVVAAMDSVRGQLRKAGYNGPVVTVDTFIMAKKYPELCDRGDYCAVNLHPFFDPNTAAAEAGAFVAAQVGEVRERLADKKMRIVVTETGWPHQGTANHLAVPSLQNQKVAVAGIRSAFGERPGDLILFSAYNDMWKKPEASTFYAEQYWGIGGANSPSS